MAEFNGNKKIMLLGLRGDDGKNAYEIAVKNGFEGTEEDWLASLKGDPGTGAPVVQTTGNSADSVMSQKAVTETLNSYSERELQDAHITRTLPNGVADEIVDGKIIKRVGCLKLSSSLMWSSHKNSDGLVFYTIVLDNGMPNCAPSAMKLCDDRFAYSKELKSAYQYLILSDGTLAVSFPNNTTPFVFFDGLDVEFIYQLNEQQVLTLSYDITPNTVELMKVMEKLYGLKKYELQDAHITRTLPNGVADEIVDGKIIKRVGCLKLSSSLMWSSHKNSDGLVFYTIVLDNGMPNCAPSAMKLCDDRFAYSKELKSAYQYLILSDGTLAVSFPNNTTPFVFFDGLDVEFIYQLNEQQVLTLSYDITPNTKELVEVAEKVGNLSETVNRLANDVWLKKPTAYNSPTFQTGWLLPLCVDNGVCYGNIRTYMRRLSSTTDFETFVDGKVFSMGIQKIVVSKTHIIVSVWDQGSTAGEIWACPKEQGVNGEFTKVFTFPVSVGVPRHGCLNAYYDDLRNIVVLASYGKFGESRFGYLSVDGGVTFKQIFEAEGDTSHYHIHDIAYDQYQDRIWIASGDYTSDKIYFSDDRGTTWTVAHGTGYQSTTIVPMPDYVIFGSDYFPVSVYKWDRRTERQQVSLKDHGDISKAMSVAIVLDRNLTAAECYSYGFYKESDNIAYLVFCGVGGSTKKSFLVATGDGGRSFHILLANSETNNCGMQVIAGEMDGKLIIQYWSDKALGTLKMDKVVWE